MPKEQMLLEEKLQRQAVFTSSDTQRPPNSLVRSKALARKPLGYWTVPPTPWIDSAKKAAKLGPLGSEYFTTSSNCGQFHKHLMAGKGEIV